MTGDGFKLFQQKMAQKQDQSSDEGMRFDPTIIVTILAAIIPMIANCFSATPRAVRRKFLNRARLATAVYQQSAKDNGGDPALTWGQAFKAADDCFDVANESRDEEVQAFINDCCGE